LFNLSKNIIPGSPFLCAPSTIVSKISLADIDSTTPGNELIVFPWYQIFSNPEQTDLTLMPSIWRLSGGIYGSPEVLWDVDRNLYNFLMFSTTYPSATAVDLDNDTDIDLVLSNGKLAVLWNIGSPDYPNWKLDIDYFVEHCEVLFRLFRGDADVGEFFRFHEVEIGVGEPGGFDAVHGVDRYFVPFLDEPRDELRGLGSVAGRGERGVRVEEDS